ncbi:MAG: FtsX-like permease family protein [Ignavibacteriota bacterium]
MKNFKLILRNIFRHKLRATLTILGIAIAVMSFGLLKTIIGAWYSNSDNAAPDRLVSRHAISFIFSLPVADRDQIKQIPGVKDVTFESWFGGIYKDKNQFFPRLACDAKNIFDIYPEFIVPPDEKAAFINDRAGCIIGARLAKDYNLKIGDIMAVDGDIYPGKWEFTVRGIYHGKSKTTEETNMFFQWEYLNEQMLKTTPRRANKVGWYVIKIANPDDAATISEKVDALFKNSDAETKTETEKAFAAGFIAMSSAIITGLQIVSYVIIGIIFLVLCNTMLMSARERTREYAVLKTLGFTSKNLAAIIYGESIAIGIIGGLLGILLTYPIVAGFSVGMARFFPFVVVDPMTVILAGSFALLVGIVSGFFPAARATRMTIVDGLRQIG